MAGTNVVLKKGEKLFQEGDSSDGMYLVRKGEILVYLEKGGKQVKLALLKEGAMIGEMALFDQKPRSASAQATADSEITKISTEDFTKLMKQIPKWFVSLMASLSSRLRETNERLQSLENKVAGATNPLHQLIRVLEALDLVFQKATKEAKEAKLWELEEDVVTATLNKLLDEKPEYTAQLVSAFVSSKLFEVRKNTYKKNVLGCLNRGQFRKLIEFFAEVLKSMPNYKPISIEVCNIFDTLEKLAVQSAYDSITIPFEELCEEAGRNQLKTDNWKECLDFFKLPLGSIQIVKTSTGLGFKVEKKTVSQLRLQIEVIRALKKIGVL
ncbi:MAG: Crp/Fnr family transcriptional regulator [Oligoflexales bacterium]